MSKIFPNSIVIKIGEWDYSSSTARCRSDDEFQLSLGGGRSRHDGEFCPHASFSFANIRVEVKDGEIAGKIANLHRTGTREETDAYLKQIVMTAIAENPQYLLDLADACFEQGRYAGRKDKAREIREVLESD